MHNNFIKNLLKLEDVIIKNIKGGIMQRYFAQTKNEDEFTLYEQDCHHIKNVMKIHIS